MTDTPKAHISPSDFMKARRPELFSDSFYSEEDAINKEQFEYHLDTITQRQEEYAFEHFCRRLAEKEVCRNLTPPTGPMGGGDAKVDTETYPVGEDISDLWYEGDPKAAKERWAFAISAKRKWQDKIRKDIEKIVNTNCGYSLIYFMTNQAVSSKKRAAMEDELKTKWDIPVRILDRSWIVEKVVQNKRWDVVYSTLKIDRHLVNKRESIGPHDAERLRELEELEILIDDSNRYRHSSYQLIEDCLQTALLARGLNHSRTETDGRFDRAERIARKENATHQLFRIIYHKAWTAYWWFDDFHELDHLYNEAESLVINSDRAWDLEKLVNLWSVGKTWLRLHNEQVDSEKWSERTKSLREALISQSTNLARPTNALWSRTQLAFMELNDAAYNDDKIPGACKILIGILGEAEGLLDYPIETVIEIVEEMRLVASEIDEYNELIEKAIGVRSNRMGETEQGRMRLTYGSQKLKTGKPYEAIEQFGKAQTLLAKSECLNEFIHSLLGIASSYESVSLLWAARSCLVLAFESTLNEYWKDGTISLCALRVIRRLIWVEIQIGRIPCILNWCYWFGFLKSILDIEDNSDDILTNEFYNMDVIFGILILRTDFAHWKRLSYVASIFDKFQLYMSRGAVLFSIGQEDLFRSESNLHDEDLEQLFSNWLMQPAADDLPEKADWGLGDYVIMRSKLLGCNVNIEAENNNKSIILAEAILSFLESFLASSFVKHKLYSARSNIDLKIYSSEDSIDTFVTEIDENEFGETTILIIYGTSSLVDIARHSSYKNSLIEFSEVITKHMQIHISENQIRKLLQEEMALHRAFLTVNMPIALCNIFENKFRYSIEDWLDIASDEKLKLLRQNPWRPTNITQEEIKIPHDPIRFADGPPPPDLIDRNKIKHKDIDIISVVNLPLWDKACWKGVGFMHFPDASPVPGLMLGFENLKDGEKIFRGWSRFLNDKNLDELVDVAIIRGINKSHPAHYRVVINANFERFLRGSAKGKQQMFVCRIQTMEPDTNTNIEIFLKLFEAAKKYYILPGDVNSLGYGEPCASDCIFWKTKLRVVNAWEIDYNDPLAVALQLDDDPIVPSDVENPPFLNALAFIKESIARNEDD